MSRFDSRRRTISYLGAAALAPLMPTPALGEGRSPTPRMTEGPFYPRSFPEDSDADLTRVTGRNGRAQGTPLEVSGRVVDRTGRAPHIHFTVAQGERRRLTSQMFVEGDPGNERDGQYRRLGREAQLVTMRLAQSGATLRGQLDIVLE